MKRSYSGTDSSTGLPHQRKRSIGSIKSLRHCSFSPQNYYENPTIDLRDARLKQNIAAVQKNFPSDYCSREPIGSCLHLDVKMETGTGKTYVYTQTMFELHKLYGINKFIIAVPSLAIKAGTAQFCLILMLVDTFLTAAVMTRKWK